MTELIEHTAREKALTGVAEDYVREFTRLAGFNRNQTLSPVEHNRPPRFSQVLTAGLGLPYRGHFGPVKSAPPEAILRGVAIRYLPRLLTSMGHDHCYPADVMAILAGISVNKCWPACLESDEDAYTLAASLVRYVDTTGRAKYVDQTGGPAMAKATKNAVCEILNEWLNLSTPWGKLPTAEELCRRLFGDVWCHFSFPAAGDTADRIMLERPAFLRGLCSFQDRRPDMFAVEPLPDSLSYLP